MLESLRNVIRHYWPKLTWKLYYWFMDPQKVTLALLVVAVVAMVVSKPRFRRKMVTACLALIAGYLFLLSPLFSVPATALLSSFVPADTGEPADAVVVLARTGRIQGDRYGTALDMVAAGRASTLLIMGRAQAAEVVKASDERNLTPNMISAVCVRTTKQEAESAAAALGTRGLNKIVLITDTPHMLRAWLTFKGLGFTVMPHVEPLPADVGIRERSLLAIREYLGLVSYGVLGRFQGQSPSTLPEVAKAMADVFPANQCFMTADQIRQVFMLS